MATRLAAFVALLCFLLVGCGRSKAPLAQPERDSAVSPAAAVVPPVTPGPETARAGAPAGDSSAAPARDTVPAIVAKAFPEVVSASREAEPFPHRVIRDRAGRVLGYEVFSDSAGVTARGYSGMVPIQVFFNARGRPVRIYILDNYETPAYLDIAYRAGLLDTLLAYNPARPDSVDAVTLATSSSRAIIDGVAGLAARVCAELAAEPKPGPH